MRILTPFFSIFVCSMLLVVASEDIQKVQTYIIYMGDRPKDVNSVSSLHSSMLQRVVGRLPPCFQFLARASESLLYSYQKSFSGFVAKLTEKESKMLAGMEGVVSVFLNQKKKLHTTKSWDFVGFPQEVKRMGAESDIIVGMLDTGVWPESDMFSDEGFGPPPTKFKGSCQSPKNFTCNNKIVGAKYFRVGGDLPDGDFPSPRDTEGHGSHTASTAAGRIVTKASLLGLSKGIARGGVPSARISVYKICWADGCYDADILAAFDEAIADGVDIISLSVGSSFPQDYFEDSIAIGAFHSMKNGILTSNSAENSGPYEGSVSNFSPWSLTVAASTIDRKFIAIVKLGNDKSYQGVSINTFDLEGKMYPLVYTPELLSSTSRENKKRLSGVVYNDTIVMLNYVEDGSSALAAGAVGAIMRDDGPQDYAFPFLLSASVLNYNESSDVSKYINDTSKPIASIGKTILIGDKLAPYVVSFSSRGPNPITSDILKPDITAPGVDIIAAWSEATTVTGATGDERVVPYNIISGTSMSCPHATGAAAYVKSFNPKWSSSAIKSALMTTATVLNANSNRDAEFAYGSGQIDPVKASNPGLIYDAGEGDYISFLCGQGYSTKSLQLITGDNTTSCSGTKNVTVWDLNYPSFALSGKKNTSIAQTFQRTITNVGSSLCTYKVTTEAPSGMDIKVVPTTLSFDSLGQKQTFVVTVEATTGTQVLSGSLIWDNEVYQVRSPIVAYGI